VLIVEAFAAANACILAPVRSARRGLLRKLSRVDLNPPVKALGTRARCPQLAVKETIRPLEFIFFSRTSLRNSRIRIIGRIFSQKTPMYFGRPARSGHGEADAIDYAD